MDKNFIESIQQLDKLPLKDRLNMLAKFMPFSIPRYHTVDIIKEMQEERLQQEDHDRTLSEIFKRVLTDEQKKQIEIEYLRYIQEQASKAANGQ